MPRAGDVVVCTVDSAMGTDGSVPMALDYFQAMGGTRVSDPARLVFALDHYAPPPTRATALLHQRMRDFARDQGIALWEAGEGIGHQLMVESGRAWPGALVVGADSHAVTYGALNCFATGIGSSDLAAIMKCGRIWLRVPESIRVELTGALPRGVYAKDIALALARELGADGAAYQALEFTRHRRSIRSIWKIAWCSVISAWRWARRTESFHSTRGRGYLRGRTRNSTRRSLPTQTRGTRGDVDIALDRAGSPGGPASPGGSRHASGKTRRNAGPHGVPGHLHRRTRPRFSPGAGGAPGGRRTGAGRAIGGDAGLARRNWKRWRAMARWPNSSPWAR